MATGFAVLEHFAPGDHPVLEKGVASAKELATYSVVDPGSRALRRYGGIVECHDLCLARWFHAANTTCFADLAGCIRSVFISQAGGLSSCLDDNTVASLAV